ncbi:MAG: 8-oxo-dGTP diphosphatase [Patescibacteria group bacterium]
MDKKVLTLCIVHQGDQVLLGMKKRGFGEGRWNGFGGKVKEGESIEESMLREFEEETGLRLTAFEKRGVLEFRYQNDENKIHEVHLFCARAFEGEPMETEEMRPQWFSLDEIPFDSMWPDDRYWFPMFLEGKKFRGHFLFEDFNTILEHSLQELEN